jgi:hypothetical protein
MSLVILLLRIILILRVYRPYLLAEVEVSMVGCAVEEHLFKDIEYLFPTLNTSHVHTT